MSASGLPGFPKAINQFSHQVVKSCAVRLIEDCMSARARARKTFSSEVRTGICAVERIDGFPESNPAMSHSKKGTIGPDNPTCHICMV